jgi:hypothetical protein
MYTKNTGCNGQAEIGSFSNRINFIPSKISGGFSLRITLADFLNISGAIHTKIYLFTKNRKTERELQGRRKLG